MSLRIRGTGIEVPHEGPLFFYIELFFVSRNLLANLISEVLIMSKSFWLQWPASYAHTDSQSPVIIFSYLMNSSPN